MTDALTIHAYLWRRGGRSASIAGIEAPICPKMSLSAPILRQKCHRSRPAARQRALNAGIIAVFGDNELNGIVAFKAQSWRVRALLSF